MLSSSEQFQTLISWCLGGGFPSWPRTYSKASFEVCLFGYILDLGVFKWDVNLNIST